MDLLLSPTIHKPICMCGFKDVIWLLSAYLNIFATVHFWLPSEVYIVNLLRMRRATNMRRIHCGACTAKWWPPRRPDAPHVGFPLRCLRATGGQYLFSAAVSMKLAGLCQMWVDDSYGQDAPLYVGGLLKGWHWRGCQVRHGEDSQLTSRNIFNVSK